MLRAEGEALRAESTGVFGKVRRTKSLKNLRKKCEIVAKPEKLEDGSGLPIYLSRELQG